MTELMVVIGIIAVLAGILLTAMGGVRRRAMSTQTESTMQEFAKACEAFQIEHNRYPGLVPEQVLADIDTTSVLPISGTENALLDLMGGARTLSPLDNSNDPDFLELGACDDQMGVLCHDLGST
ncbi:MAG: type II secretion system protein, partial [Planctomycetota bacterium]